MHKLKAGTNISFFVVLFLLIFFGDGKQEIVDIVAAGGILGLFVIRSMGGIRFNGGPQALTVGWTPILAYLSVRTFFSDDIGLSISALTRWGMGYLTLSLFSSTRDSRDRFSFMTLLIWFSVAAVLFSVTAVNIEKIGVLFDGLNLLYPAHGHNHMVNIIVFALPCVLYGLAVHRDTKHVLLALFFVIALLFSFARGAWFLAAGYLAYLLFFRRRLFERTSPVIIFLFLLVAAAFGLSLHFRGYGGGGVFSKTVLERQILKPPVLENRLRYWNQAVDAIRDRPLFGAGPGTFNLLSVRFQKAPDSNSWFAHSFPLELLAEIGAVGGILVLFMGIILRNALKNSGSSTALLPVRDGIVLTLLYSFYEINLNFLVIWLLFWASIGVILRQNRGDNTG